MITKKDIIHLAKTSVFTVAQVADACFKMSKYGLQVNDLVLGRGLKSCKHEHVSKGVCLYCGAEGVE